MTRTVLSAVAVLFLVGFAGASPAAAQTDPRLVAAVRNAQEGQGDSARVVVKQLLATTPPSDMLYPQILYTSAMIATDAAEMRRQLQRVAVEFPTSPWADDALLRLVQLDYATRNLDGAARNLERIRIDFPESPLIPQAAYWAGRTYFDAKQDTLACRWLADGVARAREDVETQRQLGYLYQRCDLVTGPDTGAKGDTLGPQTSTGKQVAGRPETSAPAARFRVQLAAVGTVAAADAVARKAQALGFATVTVQVQGLYKVRAGEFATRTEAQTAAGQLKTKLGGSPFVVSEQ